MATFRFLTTLLDSLQDLGCTLNKNELKLVENNSTDTHSLSKSIKTLLSTYTPNSEETPLTRLLKATNKEITVPASSQIKSLLHPFSKDKDKTIKGSKRTTIRFHDHTVVITHYQKNSCALEGNTSDCFFVFEWKVALTFDRNVDKLLCVSLEVVEYSFSVTVSPTTKRAILDAISSWITTETVESSCSSIPLDSAIRCLSSALLKLPSGKEIVHDPALPGGKMSAVALLELLHTAILQEDLPPIPCAEIKQGGT